MALGLQITSSN